MNILRLFYLLHTKNMVNAKRRRFYAHLSHRTAALIKPTKSITKQYASRMYLKAQEEAKSYTAEIRSLRYAFKARTRWDYSGNTLEVRLEDGRVIKRKDFKALHDEYIIENILLRDGE